jgi:hypothetical protein
MDWKPINKGKAGGKNRGHPQLYPHPSVGELVVVYFRLLCGASASIADTRGVR